MSQTKAIRRVLGNYTLSANGTSGVISLDHLPRNHRISRIGLEFDLQGSWDSGTTGQINNSADFDRLYDALISTISFESSGVGQLFENAPTGSQIVKAFASLHADYPVENCAAFVTRPGSTVTLTSTNYDFDPHILLDYDLPEMPGIGDGGCARTHQFQDGGLEIKYGDLSATLNSIAVTLTGTVRVVVWIAPDVDESGAAKTVIATPLVVQRVANTPAQSDYKIWSGQRRYLLISMDEDVSTFKSDGDYRWILNGVKSSDATDNTLRRAFNDWLRAMPGGARAMVEATVPAGTDAFDDFRWRPLLFATDGIANGPVFVDKGLFLSLDNVLSSGSNFTRIDVYQRPLEKISISACGCGDDAKIAGAMVPFGLPPGGLKAGSLVSRNLPYFAAAVK